MCENFTIILAESKATDALYPFSILHCMWEVRCGALRLFEKYGRYFPESPLHFAGRNAHIASFKARNYSETGTSALPEVGLVVLAGNVLADAEFANVLQQIAGKETGIRLENSKQETIGFVLNTEDAYRFTVATDLFSGDFFFEDAVRLATPLLDRKMVTSVKQIQYLWDALTHNGSAIAADAELLEGITPFYSVPLGGVFVLNESGIRAADSVEISPGVVLDATDGPIILSANVRVMANSVIMGPCAIGENSLIKIGAKIYGDTTFGEYCKIGGEVENSIVQGYSNKQHDGFLGHSYLGEWVNLGADTNTSDLKNTYGKIIVRMNGRRIPTERMMLGLLCGDHTKSGINTMFTTGTVAGVSSSVVGADYAPAAISSFSFGGRADSPRYNLEQALDVARTVMARRGKMLLPEEEDLLRAEFGRL